MQDQDRRRVERIGAEGGLIGSARACAWNLVISLEYRGRDEKACFR